MFDPKKAGEEADRMIAALNQPAQAEDQAGAEDAITTEDIDTSEGTTEVAVAHEPSPVATNDATLAELKRQLDAAEQRWKVLQGMIDKKDADLENMRVLFAQMQAAGSSSDAGAQQSLVTDEDRSNYGADYIDLISRVATSVAQREVQNVLASMAPTMKQMESNVSDVRKSAAQLLQERFMDTLNTKVGDWEVLNTDAGFLAWLDEMDKFTGVQRIALLRDAFAKQDVERVAEFFISYKQVAGINNAAASAPRTAEVKRFATPSKSKASTVQSDSTTPKQWSRADISTLYDDKMRGRISQAAFEELERDLFKAQREGRVAA